MPTDTIRASPYEKGLYFVGGTVGTSQWQVGTRYTLEKVLGHGGFSSVCLATDNQTGEKVALKRIPDVLSSPENAKRVLREVCILRRLSHPNIIGIKDCFVKPSATGQCRLIKGKLVNLSIDVYIAMEYAEGGDLFHLKGQLSAVEVKSIMWQLTHCIRYLHNLHVWHRDIKSQNAFVSWEGGELVVKLGDFGSARSAVPEGYQTAEQTPPNRRKQVAKEPQPRPSPRQLHSVDSYDEMHRTTQLTDIYARPAEAGEGGGRRGGSGFKAPLTRVVATPCYRAPEVVMSRGGYTAAIDLWSLGCIFGELLQRVAHVGSAATPNLQVAPLFAITDLPKTPENGEKFGVAGPGHETTRRELQALFDVIGSPSWADVAEVEHPAWRSYLHRLPGKAPSLYRRFAPAGEVAVDLVSRMLAFDPSRRCSAEEALAHEFFGELGSEDSANLDETMGTLSTLGSLGSLGLLRRRSSQLLHTGHTGDLNSHSLGPPSSAGGASDHNMCTGGSIGGAGGSREDLLSTPAAAAAAAAAGNGLAPFGGVLPRGRSSSALGGGAAAGAAAAGRAGGSPGPFQHLPPIPPHPQRLRVGSPAGRQLAFGGGAPGGSAAAAPAAPAVPAVSSPTAWCATSSPFGSVLAYGAALGAAAVPAAPVVPGSSLGGGADVAMEEAEPLGQPQLSQQAQQAQQQAQQQQGQLGPGGTIEGGEEERIRHYWEEKDPARALNMLEDELATIAATDSTTPSPESEGCQKLRTLLELECEAIAASHGGSFTGGGQGRRRRVKVPGVQEAGVLSGLLHKAGPGLQLDTASDSQADPADYGRERLNNVADTWQGSVLDPEKYLGPQRHGEWTAFSGTGPPPGPRWGVAAMPPGMDESTLDPRMAAVIKAQQLR